MYSLRIEQAMIDMLATLNPEGVTYLSTGCKPCVAEVQPSESRRGDIRRTFYAAPTALREWMTTLRT